MTTPPTEPLGEEELENMELVAEVQARKMWKSMYVHPGSYEDVFRPEQVLRLIAEIRRLRERETQE